MKIGQLLNKPEYLFRPIQIFRRLVHSHRVQDLMPARLPWGGKLYVQPTDAIGKSILTLGVHELAVSEVLWRLTDEGDTCIDVGANIGYVTALLSTRVGTTGRVISFEPHPQIFEKLRTNVRFMNNRSSVTIVECAIGAIDGDTDLCEPLGFATNEGTSSIAFPLSRGPECGNRYPIKVRRLDSIFSGDEQIGVAKIDVEGAELEVFQGAESLLRARNIRDVIWENNNNFTPQLLRLFSDCGYNVFRFSKGIFGPVLWDPASLENQHRSAPWETHNLLATHELTRALARLSRRGWQCLA